MITEKEAQKRIKRWMSIGGSVNETILMANGNKFRKVKLFYYPEESLKPVPPGFTRLRETLVADTFVYLPAEKSKNKTTKVKRALRAPLKAGKNQTKHK